MGVASAERPERLEEGVGILRRLFAEKSVSHRGRFYTFEGVTLEPRPVQQPCPIWIASNPTGLTWKGGGSASEAAVERSYRRVARSEERRVGKEWGRRGSPLQSRLELKASG